MPKEFNLLAFLFRNRGKVIPHRSLLAAVRGSNYTGYTEYLRLFIGTLRKKIQPNLNTS